jgi:hypothetical protein
MNEDEVTTNEQTTDVEQPTAEPEDQQQLPADASPDDLTLEEIVQTNDDDFEAYQKGEITAAAIREKYNFTESKDTSSNDTTNDEESNDTSTNDDTQDNNVEDNTPVQPQVNEYENLWKQVSSPFKANGKTYQPGSPEDIINLMQKGVNYTQKMQAIASYRKAFESLNKNQINEQELSFLIDLHNGDKKAIKALLDRNKIDPMEMSNFESDSTPYTPNFNNLATDSDVQVQEIMSDISANKDKVMDVVMNKWDQASKQMFLQNPNLLRLLNEEFNLGRFDTIQEKVEEAKMFGNANVPDIQLYSQLAAQYEKEQNAVADALKVQQLAQQQQQQQIAANNAASKRAAAPTRGQSRTAKRKMSTEDIWNMSDEDFEKLKYTDIQAMEQN